MQILMLNHAGYDTSKLPSGLTSPELLGQGTHEPNFLTHHHQATAKAEIPKREKKRRKDQNVGHTAAIA
jgi:hypothetical protein